MRLPSSVTLSNVTDNVLSINVFDCISSVITSKSALVQYIFFKKLLILVLFPKAWCFFVEESLISIYQKI